MSRKKKRNQKASPKTRGKLILQWIIGVIIIPLLIGCGFYILSTKDSNHVQQKLDDLIVEKYRDELKGKYPGGYMLFRIDSSKNKSKNEFIPFENNFLQEYDVNWNETEIVEITKNTVTLRFPYICYKPQNSKIIGWTQTIPRSPIGKSYPLKIDWQTNHTKLHIELIEDKETAFAFAIGFKPE